MVLNETLLMANPIFSSISTIINAFRFLVGGLFGLYLILLVLRWIEYRQMVKILKDIRRELRNINKPKKKK